MVEFEFLGPVLVVLLIVLVAYFALKLGKKLIVLLINSFLGLVALVLINFLPFLNIEINIWSVLIAALGGLPGILLLVVLSHLEIAF